MDTVLYIISLAVTGLVVGALARLGLPGRDPMSIFQTMLVGVAGSLIAGLITYYLFDSEAGAGILLSVVCALVIVFAVRKIRERQLGGAPAAQQNSGFGLGGGGGSSGSGMQVRFMPGCLITSLLFSVILTVLLNLLIRAF